MIESNTALWVALAVIVVSGLLFWPGWGLISRRRGWGRTNRMLVEDALKQVFEAQYQKQAATLASLAGTLGISRNHTVRLVLSLEGMQLLTCEKDAVRLTDAGEREALRVIRAHRLWERYLAEETSVPATAWHRHAELREHRTTPQQADELAARLRHPLYDPHGDPIPTADGALPPKTGRPLFDFPAGALTAIVHIEDEPEEVFRQIVKAGLHPGMSVQIERIEAGRFHCRVDGREQVLPNVVAANISVIPLAETPSADAPHKTLAEAQPGEVVTMATLAPSCRGMERRRLLDLGITPGTTITVAMQNPLGDPLAYRVRNALIALRKTTAAMIYVEQDRNDL